MLNGLEIKAGAAKEPAGNTEALLVFVCRECLDFLPTLPLADATLDLIRAFSDRRPACVEPEAVNVLTELTENGLRQIMLVGVGRGWQCNPGYFRRAAGTAGRNLAALNVTKVEVYAPILMHKDKAPVLEALTEGLYLGAYSYDEFKSGAKAKSIKLMVHTAIAKPNGYVEHAAAVAGAVSFSRDLINKPGNEVYPEVMAEAARKVAADCKLQIEVLDEKAMLKKGMRALLAVGQGSEHKPRLMVLKYRGNGKAPFTAYVGKGITFDSGGLSIKPVEGMGEMKDDMSGAAAVLGAIKALAEVKAKINVMAVLACAENMPDGGAQRPGDIVRAANGKTIEVITTDAEGRMVLADAVWYACQLGAAKVIDIATLTGAVIIGLGKEIAGIIANDDELAEAVKKAGFLAGEDYWRLPTNESFKKQIKSKVADLKNSGGRPGGTITGGMFIGEFIADGVAWAHLDIGGVSTVDAPYGYKPFGGTAFGVATLVKLGEQ